MRSLVLCRFCGSMKRRCELAFSPQWGSMSKCEVGICKECFARLSASEGKKK